jgi:hypothetical protein
MKAADKNAPSEMAVNLMIPDTVPATLTQRRIVFPVSITHSSACDLPL